MPIVQITVRHIVFALLFFMALPAAAQDSGLDVNDVTFLFPMRAQGGATPEIKLTDLSTIDQKALLPSALFKEIDAKVRSRSQVDVRFALDRWRVLAIRYDPCSAENAGGPCVQQVRLITQPVAPGGLDVSMHLLYRISAGPPTKDSALLSDLLKIRDLSRSLGADTRGLPLQPHPGLKLEAEVTSGPLSKMITDFVLKNCTANRLTEVTFTDANINDDGPWFFVNGKVLRGHWVMQDIPSLAAHEQMQATNNMGQVDVAAKPGSVNSINWFIFKPPRQNRAPLTDEVIDGLFRVGNPLLANSRNTDCASCHLQSDALTHYHLNPLQPPSYFSSPPGITGFAESQYYPEVAGNVRILGYEQSHPVIAPLAASSSAAVAAMVNKILELPPPTARDCGSYEVFRCFAGLGEWENKSGNGTAAVCLALCR